MKTNEISKKMKSLLAPEFGYPDIQIFVTLPLDFA